MRTRRWWAVGAGVWAVAAAGCSDQGPDDRLFEQLRSARETWAAVRPPVYRYTLERLCSECGPREQGPVEVEARERGAVGWWYAADGSPVDATLREAFPSVDGLLDLVEQGILQGADEVSVQYDLGTGVPIQIRIDYDTFVFDDERAYRVRSLPVPMTP